MKAVLFGGDNNTPGNGTYRSITTGLSGSWISTESQQQIPVSEAITITAFYMFLGTAPGVGNTWQFGVRVNGSTSAATLNIADAATSGSWTGSVSVSTGDLIDLMSAYAVGTPASSTVNWWYIEYETTGTSYMLHGGSSATTPMSATRYMLPHGATSASPATSATDYEIPIAHNCTITALNVWADGAVTTNCAVSIRQNNTTDVMTATLTSGNQTATASGSVSITAGDTLIIKTVAIAAGTARRIKYSISVTPATNGEVAAGFASAGTPQNTATNYNQTIADGLGTWGNEATTGVSAIPPYTVKNLYWKLITAPGTGRSMSLTVRDNGADTALTSTISDTNTTGNNTVNSFVPTPGARNALKTVPTNTPTSSAGLKAGYIVAVDQPIVGVTASSTMLLTGVG